jgi:hypothetical protein
MALPELCPTWDSGCALTKRCTSIESSSTTAPSLGSWSSRATSVNAANVATVHQQFVLFDPQYVVNVLHLVLVVE